MSGVLRIYDPAECDEHGVPLAWESCACSFSSRIPCHVCDGHGSLRAAALADCAMRQASGLRPAPPTGIRCESCGHPISEGTWEPERVWGRSIPEWVVRDLAAGREPRFAVPRVHYSPCDEECRHGRDVGTRRVGTVMVAFDTSAWRTEASWRPVDVRTLGWPA